MKNVTAAWPKKYEQALVLAIEVLSLYAHPESYHAIWLLVDRPAGWFADDFGYDKNYRRKMPGREARRALVKIQRLILSARTNRDKKSATRP